MKLFIWEGDGVLTNYDDGMIVALGNDLQEALNAVEKNTSHAMRAFPTHKPSRVIELDGSEKPEAWLCWGGG